MIHTIRYAASLIAVALLSWSACLAQTTSPTEDLQKTVTYLLDFVAQSDCTFIRNGKSHTPKEASEHMKGKYEYFKKEIKTPEDFIRLAASKSLVTGQAYLVKTKDGKEIDCAKWMTKVLNDYRKLQKESKKDKG
jgi:hypothetical protein